MDTRKIYTDTLNKIHRKLLSNGQKYDSVDPSDTAKDGIYSISQGGSWTESFYTGMLWLDYLITKNEAIKKNIDMQMWEFRQRVRQVRNLNHHDIGFLYSLSAVAGYKLTSEEIYKDTALMAARLLIERYQPQGKFIQAWGDIHDKNAHRLIIDCMLNIPLLYWAAEVTGDEKFYQIAYNHAVTTMENIFRPDNSTYHTFFFDYDTGKPLYGKTAQGSGDDSAWARGQAWAIYGFAISYRYTKDERFLNAAKRAADYFMKHLPADNVAYWDLCFNDKDAQPRDSSAAAIAVCGLLEIASFTQAAEHCYYTESADKILLSLCENYLSADDKESVLDHAVYSAPKNLGVDEACIWGDYYFTEALTRVCHEKEFVSFW